MTLTEMKDIILDINNIPGVESGERNPGFSVKLNNRVLVYTNRNTRISFIGDGMVNYFDPLRQANEPLEQAPFLMINWVTGEQTGNPDITPNPFRSQRGISETLTVDMTEPGAQERLVQAWNCYMQWSNTQ